LQGC